nr:PDZ domain-containing protein [Chthoniobacterales bacterium]
EENGLPKVYLFSTRDKKPIAVTDDWYASGDSVFSDDGKYLLLVSSRDFKPTFGQGDFTNVYRDMSRVYLVTLSKDTPSPLEPRSDEVGKDDKKDPAASPDAKKPEDAEKKPSPAKDEKDKKPEEPKKPVVVKVDLDGIQSRLVALKIQPADYGDIRMVGDRIFYLRRSLGDERAGDDDNPDSRKFHLCSYSLEDRKETVHGDVNSYEITSDGKKMLVKIDKDYAIIDLPKEKLELKDEKAGKDFKLKLDGLDLQLDRHAEWAQIYYEAWRQMRDFFYAPNMHGVDWKAMRDKYGALLPFVNHRNDLTYLIAELISELNIGHAYTGGGERPETARIKLGLLGAEFSRDPATRAYKIEPILPGENWDDRTRSPLTAIGVNVKPGDFVLAINGTPVSALANLYDALIGTAGKLVTLRVNSRPSDDGARDVTVMPTADEAPLYYIAWVQKNLDEVSKRTNGEVGYIHIPDMGQPGLNQFTKQYFPQINKKGLIVDVRGNGGGFVSPLVIDRLRRALVMVNIARNGMPSEIRLKPSSARWSRS